MTRYYEGLSPIGEMWATRLLWQGGGAEDAITDEVEFIKLDATSTASKANLRDGKANVIQPRGAGKMRVGLIRQFDVMPLATDALTAMREMNSPTIQAKAAQVLRLQLQHMATMQANFIEVFCSHVLAYQRVNLSKSFELLLPTVSATTGAITDHADTAISIDFGHTDSHRGDCDDVFDDPWSTAGTRIDIQLDLLRQKARRAGIPVPTDIYINSIKKGVLRSNTEFRAWAANNNQRMESILQGDGLQGLWGFNWHFVDGTYTDASGTQREVLPEGKAIITAPMAGPWVKRFNGMELVNLTGQLAFSNAEQALESLEPVYGKFAYARLSENPAQVLAYAGNNFGLGFAAQGLWVPDVFA